MAASKLLKMVGSVTGFLSDTTAALKDTDLPGAVAKAVPWAGVIGESAAEAVPPIKFLLKLYENLAKENDPQVLGHVACTLAYERSIEMALLVTGIAPTQRAAKKKAKTAAKKKAATKAKKSAKAALEPDFTGFRLDNALSHTFIEEADRAFTAFAKEAGYTDAKSRELINQIHDRFIENLVMILTNGKLREKFQPFTDYIELSGGKLAARAYLSAHAEHQRYLYEEAPLFKTEPYALTHVYVQTECGVLTLKDIEEGGKGETGDAARDRSRLDAFDEKNGGRHDILETIVRHITDESFNEFLVVQGVAGSGKSAFTLRLCARLLEIGLRPIRVRLRNLGFQRNISDEIPRALHVEPEFRERYPGPLPEDLFAGGSLFDERFDFNGKSICPFVLILDGWDEIDVAVNEGFRAQVTNMLRALSEDYLKGHRIPVVLTGRPVADVSESQALRNKTVFCTIRPMAPDNLEVLAEKIGAARKEKPIRPETMAKWNMPAKAKLKPILDRYRADAEKEEKGGESAAMEVLGQPLLAHLAFRVMARWKGELEDLLANPTTLYKSLVDITCETGGKAKEEAYDHHGRMLIIRTELRELLWKSAAAITKRGKESISYSELAERIGIDASGFDAHVGGVTKTNPLTSLLVSFFFKGGHTDLGCEFVHKPFREYLFAESIVQTLNEHARRPIEPLPERAPYWKDFDEADRRYALSRKLAEELSPQWMTREVWAHIATLLKWDIDSAPLKKGTKTAPRLDGWRQVRDDLADLWDWWGEGVHLRPVASKRSGNLQYGPPYVDHLAHLATPWLESRSSPLPAPTRTTTVDGILGDALFRLAAEIHPLIAERDGALKFFGEKKGDEDKSAQTSTFWSGVAENSDAVRRYQSLVQVEGKEFVVFKPSSENRIYFCNYTNRINAVGPGPSDYFPIGRVFRLADLRDTDLGGIDLVTANLVGAYLGGAYLGGADLRGADLRGAYLEGANLERAFLLRANLVGAHLGGAHLGGAHLRGADLRGADLGGASLVRARLTRKQLESAITDEDTRLPDEFLPDE